MIQKKIDDEIFEASVGKMVGTELATNGRIKVIGQVMFLCAFVCLCVSDAFM